MASNMTNSMMYYLLMQNGRISLFIDSKYDQANDAIFIVTVFLVDNNIK